MANLRRNKDSHGRCQKFSLVLRHCRSPLLQGQLRLADGSPPPDWTRRRGCGISPIRPSLRLCCEDTSRRSMGLHKGSCD